MEIEVTEKKKITLSEAQRRFVMFKEMKNIAGWTDEMWFDPKSGNVIETTHYHGSHSFDEDKVIREANHIDLALNLFLAEIHRKSEEDRKAKMVEFTQPSQ